MTTTPRNVSVVTPADDVPGPAQGSWTYKDYAALPDDGRRYEIVNGVLFMTPSPSEWHQTVVIRLAHYLLVHVEFTGFGRVYVAPFDVELAPDTVVQPDVLVVLNANRDRITKSRIIGAPDLVVEVASPGTAKHDRFAKREAYVLAGVPEYWMVRPGEGTVEVLVLEKGAYRSLGLFEGQMVLTSKVVPDFPVRVEQFFA